MQKTFIKIFEEKKIIISLLGIAGVVLAGILLYLYVFQEKTYLTVRIKGSPGNWWWVTPRPPDWLANAIKVGDKEYNASSRAIGEVLAVNVYDAGGTNKDVYVTAKLEVRQNSQTKKYRYKGEPLEIGGPISLNLNRTFFPGMIIEIYDDTHQEKEKFSKILTVRYDQHWPYEYEGIIVGDKMTDGAGNVIAEILEKTRRPAEKEAYTDDGRIVKAFSPVFEDFFIKIKVQAEKRNNEFVFREEQYLKIGNAVWILFPNFNFSGAKIVSIE